MKIHQQDAYNRRYTIFMEKIKWVKKCTHRLMNKGNNYEKKINKKEDK